ncbi:hypothetical protein RRG08_016872 [Elysia crispata]|uniref:Uncharacterized protein n=1 Tax=Elysia crispata TaxID=231223 RepID=A0AAE1CIU8_9GAST|nr:hypothetical protein RRG08_016872 [Elysia crispata]
MVGDILGRNCHQSVVGDIPVKSINPMVGDILGKACKSVVGDHLVASYPNRWFSAELYKSVVDHRPLTQVIRRTVEITGWHDWLVEYNGMGERRHRLYCTVSVRGLASGIQWDGREASPPLLYCFCQMTG